ncbi:IS66 family insertion sequence element accessory protein TnpA [Sphingobacterium zeae]
MNNIQEKRERMLSMIADWHQSGKSKKAYCAENGINEVKEMTQQPAEAL